MQKSTIKKSIRLILLTIAAYSILFYFPGF
jgi:hypothetical protein